MGCNPSQQAQKPSIYDSIVYNLERGNIESFDQVKYLNNVGND